MTKKTALGSLIPFALVLLAMWWSINAVKHELVQANVAANIVAVVMGELGQLRWIAVALFVCGALITVGFVVFLGHTNGRPMKVMSQALRQGDISEDLTTKNNEVCREYNGFIKKLRDILRRTRTIGLEVAVGSTEVARAVKDLRATGKKNGGLSEAIYFASVDMSNSILDVLRNNHSLHQSATTNLTIAKTSLEELRRVHIGIVKTGNSVAQFKQTAERLTAACKHVKEMADMADEISGQMHSLALKVATKAAGAGDKDREFSPIGDELKKMAERASAVGSAEILVNMLSMVRDVQNMGGGIHENMDGMGEAVKSTIGQFENLVRAFEGNKDQLSMIEAAMEELSGKNTVIHSQVTDSREINKEVEAILSDADKAATAMNRKTEVLLEAVSQFKIGNDGLEQRIATVASNRDLVQSRITAMWVRGINVFDHNYQPVPNTNPQKYHTAFDSHFDKELQVIFDQAAQALDAIYCVASDMNGYVSTHHARVSKPMTGNYDTDILYSRDRRMYNSTETEIRRFKNTNPFLLQTYLRDTGEILNDISMPIYVDGKHWGCIVAGFQPQKLHTQLRTAPSGRLLSASR